MRLHLKEDFAFYVAPHGKRAAETRKIGIRNTHAKTPHGLIRGCAIA
jgi:hypothetical protein